jgi:hypothetical protein
VSQLAAVPELESELDRLFELPPAEFTAARNDLAGRLKKAGQSDAATRVLALRKPTIPVWTINQLARHHADDVQALITAGDELRATQETALARDERERLRVATATEREALRVLTQRAQALLTTSGQRATPAVLERIAATLRAAALDESSREVLVAGRLSEERESAGFGAVEGMRVPDRPKDAEPRPKRSGAAEKRRREQRLRKLRERAKTLEQRAATARREAAKLEAAAERARREADQAATAAERANAEFRAAEDDASA